MATIFSFKGPRDGAPPPANAGKAVRDWTNQELSDFYRAVASLGQAGIAVEMDRGLTDEGEPWMVLCRLDGEVFIHFCRMDGQYLLDSPALGAPLRGPHFAALVDHFIAQASRAAAPNVVAFRASKVFLHPAALLTILVWSLYVWSSDTGEAHAAEWSGDGDSALLPALAPEHAAEGPLSDGTDTPPSTGKPAPLPDATTPERLANRLIQAMDHAGALAAGNQAAAMQLLAVVSTLVLTTSGTTRPVSDGESRDTPLLDTLLAVTAPDAAQPLAEQPRAAPEIPSDIGALLVAAQSPADAPLELHPHDPHIVVLAGMHAQQDGENTAYALPALHTALFVSPAPAVVTHSAQPVTLSQPADGPTAPAKGFATLLGTGFSLERYHVNGLDLLASVDPTELQGLQISGGTGTTGLFDLVFDAPQLVPDPVVPQGTFTEAARDLIDAFLDQAGDLQIVASATELVLIDLTAFDDTMDRAYAYSWSMEDGGTISALGHIEFFADYALV